MNRSSVDIVVVGSGFAGSLAALLLSRLGRSVLVIDRDRHPRFAIGESSTPIANLVLADLAVRFDLPDLQSLANYGSWKRDYPQLDCGLKRGFSYFQHQPGCPFQPTSDHRFELMVAASSRDELGDTHWLRSDLDAHVASLLAGGGVELREATRLRSLQQSTTGSGWQLELEDAAGVSQLGCQLIVDASGAGQVLADQLQLANTTTSLRTHSQAIFSHFDNLPAWQEWLAGQGVDTGHHPFDCDQAAQHHLLDGGWLWLLRFDSGLASAGICYDPRRSTPADDWHGWLASYPSLNELFSTAQLAQRPGQLIASGRLQRRVTPAAGPGWLLLPHSAGFIDPLHSTGIAHTMLALERLLDLVERDWGAETMAGQLQDYSDNLQSELDLVDRLVSGCYLSLPNMDLFRSFSMLYFAAAITCEEARRQPDLARQLGFLCARDADFSALVDEQLAGLQQLLQEGPPGAASIAAFQAQLAVALEPFNSVGLCDPALNHMYSYTATA
jgi:FADH2 O2-dependent halogenase